MMVKPGRRAVGATVTAALRAAGLGVGLSSPDSVSVLVFASSLSASWIHSCRPHLGRPGMACVGGRRAAAETR